MRRFYCLPLLSILGGGGIAEVKANDYKNNIDDIGLALRRERAFNVLRTNRQNFRSSNHRSTKKSGLHVLNRVPRGNSKLFEEIGGDDWKQECVEEQCTAEEASEAILSEDPTADQAAIDKKYKYVNKSCHVFPCSPRGTKECWRYWGWRECKCFQFGFLAAGSKNPVLVDAFTKSDEYTVSPNYPFPDKDQGTCDQPVDICQYYKEKNTEICTGDHERCENAVPLKQYHNKLKKAGQPIPENFQDYGIKFPGYVCACEAGYERDPTNATLDCVKIDYCNLEGFCPADSICIRKTDDPDADENTPDFRCECINKLFQLDSSETLCVPKYCADFPEDYCEKEKANSDCIEDDLEKNPDFEENGVICGCKDGFVEDENEMCVDIDECSDKPDPCADKPNTTCQNKVGSFECICQSGFEESENGDCVDINECEKDQNSCPDNKTCRNTEGSFVCCDSKTDIVDENGKCVPLDCSAFDCSADQNSIAIAESDDSGTLPFCICTCKLGYSKDPNNLCENINECEIDGENCVGENVQCVDQDPHFECICDEGYKLNDDFVSCSLDDPCAATICENDDEICHASSDNTKAICCKNYQNLAEGSDICVDDPTKTCGKYTCDGSLMNCEIVKSLCQSDQCGNIGKCGPGRFCLEWDGRYLCKSIIPRAAEDFNQCDPGLELDWETKKCLDVDECQIDNGNCPRHCMNFYAGYHCYDDLADSYKFCHHTHQTLSPADISEVPDLQDLIVGEKSENKICDCFGDVEYGLCEDKFSCVSKNWNSAANTVNKLIQNSSPTADCSNNPCMIAYGDKCFQAGNNPVRGALAESLCAQNGGSLAKVNSRELWFVLGNLINDGSEPFVISPDTDDEAANMVVLGDEDQESNLMVLIANLEKNMNIVPPAFRWVSNLLEYYYFCEYPSGSFGHDCDQENIATKKFTQNAKPESAEIKKPAVSEPEKAAVVVKSQPKASNPVTNPPKTTEEKNLPEETTTAEPDNDDNDGDYYDDDHFDDYEELDEVDYTAPLKTVQAPDEKPLMKDEPSLLFAKNKINDADSVKIPDNLPGPNDILSDIIDDAEYDESINPLAATSSDSDDYNEGEFDPEDGLIDDIEYDDDSEYNEDVSNETEDNVSNEN